MGNWSDIFIEIGEASRVGPFDQVRRKYLRKLHDVTGRSVVAYYSGFLQKPTPDVLALTAINDDDKNAFMACFHGLDYARGLDLILHSPGGDVAATESIINYIRSKFGNDIRTIVPQISMSGGTMMALAGREIVMARHSNLGPIDPQYGNFPAQGLLDEFERAKREVTDNPSLAPLWAAILQHYSPTLLSKAKRALDWSREIASKTLVAGMLKDAPDAEEKAREIVDFLLSADVHYAHNRHIHRDELRARGLTITYLEEQPDLQEAVLSVHHAFMNTLSNTQAVKIIENHNDVALVKQIAIQMVPSPAPTRLPMPQPPAPPMPPEAVPAPVPISAPLPWKLRLKLAWQLLRKGC